MTIMPLGFVFMPFMIVIVTFVLVVVSLMIVIMTFVVFGFVVVALVIVAGMAVSAGPEAQREPQYNGKCIFRVHGAKIALTSHTLCARFFVTLQS